jgi:hypothetical protein
MPVRLCACVAGHGGAWWAASPVARWPYTTGSPPKAPQRPACAAPPWLFPSPRRSDATALWSNTLWCQQARSPRGAATRPPAPRSGPGPCPPPHPTWAGSCKPTHHAAQRHGRQHVVLIQDLGAGLVAGKGHGGQDVHQALGAADAPGEADVAGAGCAVLRGWGVGPGGGAGGGGGQWIPGEPDVAGARCAVLGGEGHWVPSASAQLLHRTW